MPIDNLPIKKRKLIVYSSAPFFDTWPKKFNLDKFKNYGFDVELWSSEEIFYKQENIKAAISGSKSYLYKDLEITKIKDFVHFKNKVANLDNQSIVCIMTLGTLNNNNSDNPDLDIFNKYKINYVFHHMIPYNNLPNLWSKFKLNFRLLQKRRLNSKKKPSLIFGSGSQGRNQAFKIYKGNFIYKSVPSFNILWSKEDPIINEKYIVYVEEAADSPPDAVLFGIKNPNHDIEGYYKRINNVFDQIENWTNYKVVIAASGKYTYNHNPFNEREIIYKKTANLIQHSKLVLGHKSLGVGQAIIDYKPLLLFKDKGFIKLKNQLIHNLALAYGINPLWTNQLTHKNFEKNNHVNIIRNKEIINQYYKEENVTGTFIENITSALRLL